ncbi:MAG: DPP IV N-terminal domain-containing protein [Gemmatimonadetes bacterium]|nr:DPP IV N-terminal domain-containing protein [Gemmatimonadota bacterium]
MRPSALLLATVLAQPSLAQAPRALTAQDYARAEQFMGYNTNPLVFGAPVRPSWLPGDRFWYRNTIPEGAEFVLVDPARRTRARAFDHERLAAALSRAADTSYGAFNLPFTQFELSSDGRSISFDARGRRWTCDVQGTRCTGEARRGDDGRRNAVVSPDGKRAAFVRDYNLWVRDLSTGAEKQLTTDGIEDFGYATNNAGWVKSDMPVVVWSPESQKIATFQHDGRAVGEMYLVETRVGHPVLEAWKYPLPGDSAIFTIHRVIIDVGAGRVIRLQMPPDPHRSSLCDHVVCGGQWADVEWSPDGSQLFFLSTSRDHQREQLRVADAATGAVRDILQETVETFFESGNGRVNWHALPASNEILWFSQRDDWGHLYLYDLTTGQLKHQITRGAWNVLQVLRIDERAHTIYFLGAGREAGDPYFRKLYSVRMDGSRLTLLTPEDANHDVTWSPSGRFFVDSYSRPDVPPVTVLRDPNGRAVVPLEKADISRLLATGWTPPTPFTVKARDGRTDLYGLMYRPTGFDSTKRYPIINHHYPGPQSGSIGSRSFSAARGDARALAELGFVVVQIDGMGTPMRSKSFHAAYYGNMGDNGLPDQIAGMKELASRHPWIDLERAGIYGHSGGGFSSADAILRYPEFFKVAVSQAGNHDNRNYEDDWAEKWQGLLKQLTDSTTNYDNQANQLLAKNLRGKLLIAHGTMDDNVPYYSTLLVVNELIRHNKDFDFILFPNRRHGFGNEPYMVRRRWDYFVRHLMGAEPPQEYRMRPPGTANRPGP